MEISISVAVIVTLVIFVMALIILLLLIFDKDKIKYVIEIIKKLNDMFNSKSSGYTDTNTNNLKDISNSAINDIDISNSTII